jgi:hypothetical protein
MMFGGGEFEIAAPPRRPWMERWFPRPSRPFIDGETRTFVATTVIVRVGWPDRLRVLVSGRAELLVTTYTDVEVQQASSTSCFGVLPPW